jgi:hypothetical protein
MAARVIEWDQEKLYDQIWTRPLRTVAHEHGLSDVALAKVCKKLHIPRPGVGYWRRKECGFKVERVPLPPAKGSSPWSATCRIFKRSQGDCQKN